MKNQKIGVMCGSSNECPKKYLELAYQVGQELAKAGRRVIYGGGAKGLMTNVADGALAEDGEVFGYIPEFMVQVEWQHKGLTELHITKDMAERKKVLMDDSDATVFLPGGCGTMEEFFEWLSNKRLGLYSGALVIVNFEGYYNPLLELLDNMEKERFHNPIHSQMWVVCENAIDIVHAIDNAPEWIENAIDHASVKSK
jgi:uncharacterized protein (TIGR00730 family)